MTIQEVVSLVGMPAGCFHPYLDRLTWWLVDREVGVNVIFQEHPDDPAILIVKDVVLMDEDSSKSIINHKYIPFID